jgi:hypothetical protein
MFFSRSGRQSPKLAKALTARCRSFFDPVLGGPEVGKGWPFGRSIFPSEISQQLVKVAGVDYVTKIAINGLEPGKALRMLYNGLPTAGKHAITTVTFEARAKDADSAPQRKNCV